uniref:Uncharacterized protein n=1 Tax=Magnetococcus massalia (strain MO-1) TaxID=451514 RepID=A0A1S7LNW6_MAGMO|nr:Protein of unknown function [Candidatus Magnetococcus massalia]
MNQQKQIPLGWRQAKDVMIKVMGAVYFGGIYGLILIGMMQLWLMFSQSL